MADTLTKEARSRNMSAIRSTHTKLENRIAKELWNRGYRFRRNVRNLYGRPDLAMKKWRIAVFIDSCFWHGCSEHSRLPSTNQEYWQTKMERNKERDRVVTAYYQNAGWTVLRYWEHEIKKDFERVIEEIGEHVQRAKEEKTRPISNNDV